ncbi:MAG: hypothetical protein JO147_08115 [Actinobacteria bacterium]|nr:hypothetical protein [Actinomycetota bacterium]
MRKPLTAALILASPATATLLPEGTAGRLIAAAALDGVGVALGAAADVLVAVPAGPVVSVGLALAELGLVASAAGAVALGDAPGVIVSSVAAAPLCLVVARRPDPPAGADSGLVVACTAALDGLDTDVAGAAADGVTESPGVTGAFAEFTDDVDGSPDAPEAGEAIANHPPRNAHATVA